MQIMVERMKKLNARDLPYKSALKKKKQLIVNNSSVNLLGKKITGTVHNVLYL